LKDNKRITGIVLVAGSSTRYGQNRNKNFEMINQKSVLSYTLEAFDKNEYIDDIIVASKEEDFDIVKKIVKKAEIQKNVNIVLGGATRKESVNNCIIATDADIVIIHDGARPFIRQEYINKCIECIDKIKGATIGVKSKDTIKITDNDDCVINTTLRSNTWIVQTPQCFDRKILLDMHKKYENTDVTDDCMLLEKENYKVKMIEGDYTNIKITTYEDLDIMKIFMKNNIK